MQRYARSGRFAEISATVGGKARVENGMDEHDELIVTVESLIQVQDRYDAEHSDGGSTGRSDGSGGDGLNFPEAQ